MSDCRFEIVDYNDIPCLHVMIDAEPLAEAHIPLDDIQEAMGKSYAQLIIESTARLFEDTEESKSSTTWTEAQ